MRLWNKNNPEPPSSDEETPDDPSIINESPIENEAEPAPAAEDDAPEFLSSEQLDELYDDSGAPRWELEDGTPCDQQGNPIPTTRPVSAVQDEPVQAEDEPVPAPAPERPRPNFRSPFADGLLSAEERAQAEELIDPAALGLIETISARIADRIVAADRQQTVMARDLGIAPEYQDEVIQRMTAVQPLVPHNLRGTKQGNDAALALAAIQEAGETGSIIEVIQRWGNRAPAEPAIQPRPAAPAPKKQTPFMAPSARTTVPRGAPEAVRSNKPGKMVGALSTDTLAMIQAERTSAKNGR